MTSDLEEPRKIVGFTIEFTIESVDRGLLNLVMGLNEDGSIPEGWEWEEVDPSDPSYDAEYCTQRLVRVPAGEGELREERQAGEDDPGESGTE